MTEVFAGLIVIVIILVAAFGAFVVWAAKHATTVQRLEAKLEAVMGKIGVKV
jgi:hypothetical protein